MNRRSSAYEHGYAAFDAGVDADDCPHGFDTQERADWWSGFQRAMFESEDSLRAQDYRLDDPRHGQAMYLNKRHS